jgi:hypothetical protein
LRDERERAQSIANTADSLLKAERAAQDRLAQQLRQAEAEVLALKADLGFFERLLPAPGDRRLQVRSLQAEAGAARAVALPDAADAKGKAPAEFKGRYDIAADRPARRQALDLACRTAAAAISVKQYARVEGTVDHPQPAVVKTFRRGSLDRQGPCAPPRPSASPVKGRPRRDVVLNKKQPPIRSLIGEGTVVHGELRSGRPAHRRRGPRRRDRRRRRPQLLVISEKARVHGKVMAGM